MSITYIKAQITPGQGETYLMPARQAMQIAERFARGSIPSDPQRSSRPTAISYLDMKRLRESGTRSSTLLRAAHFAESLGADRNQCPILRHNLTRSPLGISERVALGFDVPTHLELSSHAMTAEPDFEDLPTEEMKITVQPNSESKSDDLPSFFNVQTAMIEAFRNWAYSMHSPFHYELIERPEPFSDDEIAAFLRQPEAANVSLGFNFAQYDLEKVIDWINNKRKSLDADIKYYQELKAAHPGNPLFRDELPDSPAHYVSVYRAVPIKYLDDIAAKGLVPIPPSNKSRNDAIENEFDKMAREFGFSFSRKDVLYAAHGLVLSSQWMGYGSLDRGQYVVLEFKVDPRKVFITDAESYTAAFNIPRGLAERYVEEYWGSAITLAQFLAQPLQSRYDMFNNPEVLLPLSIPSTHIRVVPKK